MAHEPFLADMLDAVKAAASALAPSALGSLVAQIHEKGLGWRDRALGLTAGSCTSYYITLGAVAWFGLDQFVGQAIGFVLGMVAFKSTPRFIAATSDLVATLPNLARDWLTKRKDRT